MSYQIDDPNEREFKRNYIRELQRKFSIAQAGSRADVDLKFEIEAKHQKMISDLESGKVKSNTYLDQESIGFSPEEYANLMMGGSKSFEAFCDSKVKLKKARRRAELQEKEKEILSGITGKDLKDEWSLDKAKERLSEDETAEYQRRMLTSESTKVEIEKTPEEEKEEIEKIAEEMTEEEKERKEIERQSNFYQAN